MLFALVLLAATTTPARPIAVLPVTGAGVTLADVADLAAVDDAVRAAVARESLSVQPKEQTVAALVSAKTAGVVCAIADVACWKKIAVLDEVELIALPVATPRKDGFAVVLTVVDVNSGRHERSVAVLSRGRELDQRARALVDDVLAKLSRAAVDDVASSASPNDVPNAAAVPSAPVLARDDGVSAAWVALGVGVGGLVVGAVGGALIALAASAHSAH